MDNSTTSHSLRRQSKTRLPHFGLYH